MAMLVQLALVIILLYCTCVAGNVTPCVCTRHMITRILDKPATTADVVVIGTMFQHDCKKWNTNQLYSHAGYYAIQHYHQIGYVEADADVVAKNCSNFSLQPDDRLTTSTTTTTTTMATTPSPYLPMCNKLAVFTDIAKEINVGLLTSTKCPDAVHHDADVAVSAFCGAPEPSLWLRGAHVMSNCAKLANYIPVALFDRSTSYSHHAGILLACHNGTLHVAIQDCSSPIHIKEITPGNHPGAGEFYVVEW